MADINTNESSSELDLRLCTENDISELCQLVADVNWDQVATDCRNFMKHGEIWGVFNSDHPVACAAWVKRSEDMVWIGMVITRPEWRGRSIATKLMKKLLERTSQFRYHLLDASAMGEPVYRKLGFADMYRVSRISWQGKPTIPAQLEWVKFDSRRHELPGVAAGDPLVAQFMENAPELSYVGLRDGKICAWFSGRAGRTAMHIGPLWAEDTASAIEALGQAAQVTGFVQLTLDIVDCQEEFKKYLFDTGAVLLRDFLRMSLPETGFIPEGIYLGAGPEYG